MLAPPVAPNTAILTTIAKKTIIPRKSPTPLPPLSKVRCCRPKKFGRLPEGLPHQPSPRTNPSKNRTIPLAFRRMSVCVCLVGFASLQSPWAHTLRHPCLACSSRCTEYCHSHNNCKKTIIPQKSPSHLPPLSKGGGLTERHKPLYCCFLLVPRPPFLFTKPFCRQDGGIATSPRFAPHSYRPLSKVRCCRRKNSGDYRRDCHTYRTLSVSLTPPLTISHSTPNPRKTAPSHSLFVLRVRQPHFPQK